MSRLRRPGQQQVSPRADRPNPQGPMQPPPSRHPAGKAIVGRIIHTPEPQHICHPGIEYEGQKPQIRPIGTIWECAFCKAQWRMEAAGWDRTCVRTVEG